MQLNRDALLARWRADRLPFLAALGFGLLAHGFLLTNKIPVDDDLPNFFNKGATYVSGRYGLELLRLVMPDVSMPWIYGWMSLALLALAVCVMLRLFRIKSPALRLLLAGVFVTFPAETGTLCYMFTAVPYALALLLTVTGVALFAENRRGRWLLSPLLIAFSCSIYQGYFAFAASFCVILLIRALAVEGKDAKPVLLDGFRLLGMLLLALALYGLAILTAAKLLHLPLLGEAVNSRQSLPLRAAVAYSAWLKTLLRGYFAYVPSRAARLCHVLLLLTAGAALILRVRRGRDVKALGLLALCLFLFPLSCYCLYLLADNSYIHALALYPFASLYVLCAVLLDGAESPAPLRRTGSLALALVLAGSVYFANAFTLRAKLQYENTYALYAAVVAEVFETEGFDENARVALIGQPAAARTRFDSAFDFDAFTLPGVNITDRRQAENVIRLYLGFDLPFVSEEEQAALAESPEFAEMPVWPYAGSVQKIGDVVAVKLGEVAP